MANKDPSKTEKATPKKIQDTRREGNVMTSMDVTSFAIILGGILLLLVTAPVFAESYRKSFEAVLSVDCRESWDAKTFQYGTLIAMKTLFKVLAPITLGLCLVALLVMRAQVGKYFSMKALKWKFNSLNPKSGIQSLIPNKTNFVKLLITIGKITVVGFFVYYSIRSDWDDLLALTLMPFRQAYIWLLEHSYIMVLKIIAFLAVLAVVDYIVRRRKYFDDLMMSKQEVKDEHRNAEGDPLIKGKIRQKMRELFFMRMIVEVPQADVVVTNPTHVAVALRYEPGSFAPKVVAKGLRKRALRIKEIAKNNGVPIVEAPPLARSLYRNTKLGGYISEQFYTAVASILAKLQKTGKKIFS